jgi:hypothetical protein
MVSGGLLKIEKLLWIVTDPERVRAPNSYMNAVGIETKIETSIQQALQGIAELAPQAVVLSVEILTHNSLEASQLIEATYGTTVALYSESGNISNLPSEIQRNIIIAPASGPKILMRLQTLIDRKTSHAPQTVRGASPTVRKARLTGSTLETAILLALDKLFNGSYHVAKAGFTKLGKIAAVGVKSTMATGYLIANFDKKLPEGADLGRLEVGNLPGLNHTEIQSQYLIEWDLQDHDILEWAAAEALFWAPIENEKGQLNVIFLESELHTNHLRPSPVAKMTSVDLVALPTDQELPAALLLWLSVNQKLIPYVKAHTALLPEQKDRLLRNGIDTLEVHKEDEASLVQHLIKLELERTLRNHRADPAL